MNRFSGAESGVVSQLHFNRSDIPAAAGRVLIADREEASGPADPAWSRSLPDALSDRLLRFRIWTDHATAESPVGTAFVTGIGDMRLAVARLEWRHGANLDVVRRGNGLTVDGGLAFRRVIQARPDAAYWRRCGVPRAILPGGVDRRGCPGHRFLSCGAIPSPYPPLRGRPGSR